MANFTATTLTDGSDIFVSADNIMLSPPVTLASPTAYVRGNAVALYNAKHYLYDSADANLDVVAGIVVDDISAVAADVEAKIYVQGEFLKGKITATSPTELAAGVYAGGLIVVKEAK